MTQKKPQRGDILIEKLQLNHIAPTELVNLSGQHSIIILRSWNTA
jgi:hypothetical protein